MKIVLFFLAFVLPSLSLYSQFTWEPTGLDTCCVSALCIDSTGNILAGTTKHGLWYSSNNGISWGRINNSLFSNFQLKNVSKIEVMPNGTIMLQFAEIQTIFFAKNNFIFDTLKLPDDVNYFGWHSVFTTDLDNRIYFCTKYAIYFTDNYGESWQHLPQVPDNTNGGSYAVTSIYKLPDKSLIGMSYNDKFSYNRNFIVESIDGGKTWNILQHGKYSNSHYLIIDNYNNDIIYNECWEVFHETDSSKSYEYPLLINAKGDFISNGLPGDSLVILSHSYYNSDLIISLINGDFYKWNHSVKLWTKINDNKSRFVTRNIVIDKNGTIYAASNGVFKTKVDLLTADNDLWRYHNPCSDFCVKDNMVIFHNLNSAPKIVIYNNIGAVSNIYNINDTCPIIDISTYSPGVYFIQFNDAIYKFVKN